MEVAYFAFISLGILPGDLEARPEEEKLLMLAMMERAAKALGEI